MGFKFFGHDDEEELAQKEAQALAAEPSKPVDPQVKEYLSKKYGLDQFRSEFGDEARKKAEADADERKSGLGWIQFGAGIGDAIAGRSPSRTSETFANIRKGIDDETIGKFEKRKKSALEDYSTHRQMDQNSREDELDSDESKVAQSLLMEMGMPEGEARKVSATRFKELSPNMMKMYEIKQRALDRQNDKEERRFLHGIKAEEAREKHDESAMQKLSKDVAGTQDMVNALDEAEAALGARVDDFQAENGALKKGGKEVDLPGVSIPMLGRISAYDDKARALNDAASKVFNATLKDRAGATVTNPEMERLKQEFSQGKYNNEAELVKGLQRYKRQVMTELKNREAAFNPRVVAKYTDQGGRTSKTIPTSLDHKPKTYRVQNTQTGQIKLIPESQLEAALANGGKLVEDIAGN